MSGDDTTLILLIPDIHAGSPVALYPNEVLPLLNGPRGPSALQAEIHRHWIEVLEYTALAKKEQNARLVVVVAGDLVEGVHHGSQEIISPYLTDHQKIAEYLIREAKRITNYDTIYFLDGTPAHAGENEYNLAEVLQGERYAPGKFTWPILKKRVYNNLVYIAHQGPASGRGMSAGNPLRNKIKSNCYEFLTNDEPIPDYMIFAHYHVHQHERVEIGNKTIDGYLLPSWKLIDNYVSRINPFAFSNIGAMLMTCKDSAITCEMLTIHIQQDKIGVL
jgi:hypothetical protein